MAKKQKFPRAPKNSPHLAYRSAIVRADKQGGAEGLPIGLPIVLATEQPVRVFDYESRMVVDEVLLMSGLEVPENGQVPMLDSHMRWESRDVIGSIRDFGTDGDELPARAYFASNEHAQEVRALYDEGHMTDFSIGFEALDVARIKPGAKKTIEGRTYTGPMRIVTRSRVKEGSAVAIGADDRAKVKEIPALRAYLEPEAILKEAEQMNLRDLALTSGMPAEITDPDEVLKWVGENLRSEPAADPPADPPAPDPDPNNVDAVQAERQRAAEIMAMCRKRNLPEGRAESYIASTLTAAEVAQDIINREKDPPPIGGSPRIETGPAQADKVAEGARGALTARCLSGLNLDRAERHVKGEYEDFSGNPIQTHNRDMAGMDRVKDLKETIESPMAREFRNCTLSDLARIFVETSGQDVRRMTKQQICEQAFRLDMYSGRGDGAAYHTTGTFSNVLLDAANKTLLAAYDEAQVTYPLWVRNAPSAPDYKTLNRIRLGEVPDPQIVSENAPYGEAAVSDNKESYHVEKYGEIFSISLEAVVNDDLNAISRIPAMQGAAMRRKVNKVCYAVLTANAALSDAVALFHATSHGAKLDATALSIAALNTGFTVMMTQTGIDTGVTLNLMPRFIIGPAALSATILQLVHSTADPTSAHASTEDAARPGFNSGVVNLYGPQGPRRLVPVIDGVLDGTSATGWYLAAETSQVDTVEVTFLQGEEAPVLQREIGFTVDAVRYKVRQSFAAAAIDYRGLYQGNA